LTGFAGLFFYAGRWSCRLFPQRKLEAAQEKIGVHMGTYAGKLLRIDLTGGKSMVDEIPDQHFRNFISARGLGSQYLYDEVKGGTDPLSPENRLILSIGVLGGTGLQGFSKWAVTTKSPLTGTIFRAVTGGNFGVWMKHAGYDLIIIQGKAEKPCHVHIDRDGVHFLDAKDLMGLDYRRVQIKLKERHGPLTESACIGPAGEKLVRYAVISSGERTASRGGVGTVMGSKGLKAISINAPIQKPAPYDRSRFANLVTQQIEILKHHPRKKNMSRFGTPYITTVVDSLGILPVKNFQEGHIQTIQEIAGKDFFELKRAKAGCHVCMTRCGGMRDVTLGPFSGSRIDGPEYETIYAFGPLLGITDKQFVINANALCDYYGLDTISTGVCVAYACELFEKGLVSQSDTNGLDLRWGNQEAFFSLIEMIGRRKGFGELLGEGVKRGAKRLGSDTSLYAMHIKGLEMPGYDPRGVKGYGLSMATSNMGGTHMYGRPREELSGKTDPYIEEGKGQAIARVQKEQALEDSLIACTFGNTGLDLRFYPDVLLAATGIDAFGSPDSLLEIGERIICLERCFNLRDGFSRKDDSLPRRMLSEPLRNAGPATGQVISHLDRLLDEYYEALGYTKEGVPTAEKLKELRIDFGPDAVSQ
jgi:aldehyde:ferredoxin oxidoreductase